MRVFYAAGPGDVIDTFRHWKKGHDDPSEPAVAYSGQFFTVCSEFSAKAYLITACTRRGSMQDGDFQIEHRPRRLKNARGILYHLGQVWNGLRLIAAAIRFRADVAIVAEGSHWFLFSLLTLARIAVVPTLQSPVYQRQREKTILRRIINRLNGRFFRKRCHSIISMPHDLPRQIAELTDGDHPPIVEFLPLYCEDAFGHFPAPSFAARPFRVLYAGRIETIKGVFDLLDVARRFSAEGRRDIEFDVCGSGTALAALRHAASDAGITDGFHIHGYCDQHEMHAMYGRCHAVIVPTRTESGEGFNKVVAEAVLASRPAITSAVCPALSYVRDAVVEVPPDDVNAYYRAVLSLVDDSSLYERKYQGCLNAQLQFYDPGLSWGSAFRRTLAALEENRAPSAFSVPHSNGDRSTA